MCTLSLLGQQIKAPGLAQHDFKISHDSAPKQNPTEIRAAVGAALKTGGMRQRWNLERK